MSETKTQNPGAKLPGETVANPAVKSIIGAAGLAGEVQVFKDTLPCTVYGVEVTPEVLDDFDNPALDGLTYKIGPAPLTVDEQYDGWYKKDTGWGDRGAGIYAYVSLDRTLEYQESVYRKAGRQSHLSTLRLSEARMFESENESFMNHPLQLSDNLLDAYETAVGRWRELSKLHPDEQKKIAEGSADESPKVRNTKKAYFSAVEDHIASLRDLPPEDRPLADFTYFRNMGRQVPFVDALDGEAEKWEDQNRGIRFGGSYSYFTEAEIFSLFLEELGYDGVLFSHNSEHPSVVVWNMKKIGTVEDWKKRLDQKSAE